MGSSPAGGTPSLQSCRHRPARLSVAPVRGSSQSATYSSGELRASEDRRGLGLSGTSVRSVANVRYSSASVRRSARFVGKRPGSPYCDRPVLVGSRYRIKAGRIRTGPWRCPSRPIEGLRVFHRQSRQPRRGNRGSRREELRIRSMTSGLGVGDVSPAVPDNYMSAFDEVHEVFVNGADDDVVYFGSMLPAR